MALQSRTHAKPSLSQQEQLCLLQKKGLIIPNPDLALHFLRFIGYYRLSCYFPLFQKTTDNQFNKILTIATNIKKISSEYATLNRWYHCRAYNDKKKSAHCCF